MTSKTLEKKEGRKEKLRRDNAPPKNEIALRIRPNRTIITIKSKDSHCDTKDQNLVVAFYKRHI